jgi:hypothetical protein
MSATTTPGKGRLRAIGAAFQARALAEQTAAKARLAASKAKTPTTSTPPAGVAPASPQQATTVPSAPPPPPAATGADAADLAVLKEYQGMSGPSAITYFLQHERAILRARAGVPSDMGKHKALHGIDRVTAAMRVPSS